MNLRGVLVIQVVLVAGTYCILIPSTVKEDRTVVPRLGRASTWETVLRQAAYQSLAKYTGFTDSLDEKIQRDQILWSKILAAHVQRTNKQDGDINIKTGTLVDEPSGNFEFRREKSLQSCTTTSCIDNSKLLAVWKIQRVKPNHLVVRMKVPLSPSTEDTYQYTPSLGLKLQSSKEIPKIPSTTYIPEVVEIPKKNKSIVFPDHGQVRNFANIYKAQQSQERPVALYYVPTEQSTTGHVMFPQTSNVLSSHDLVAQHNTKDRYGLNSQTVKAILSEFQQDSGYNGFVPSMGPTEIPFKSTPNMNQYRPDLKPNKITPTIRGTYKAFKQTTPANFKPSTHFVQYSEQDPFYYSKGVQTDKIPTQSFYSDSKTPFNDAYTESSQVPIRETLIGNRKIPTKDFYSDNFKFPPKGMYWDNKEYPKEVFVNTGRPFELTSLKEIQESSINYHAFTTPKDSSQNYLVNNYNKRQKYPTHSTTPQPEVEYPVRITTQEFNEKYPAHTTTQDTSTKFAVTRSHFRKNKKPVRNQQESAQTLSNKHPIVVSTENGYETGNLATQETIQKYPATVTTEEPETEYTYTTTPQVLTQRYQKERPHRTTVRFPSELTTELPFKHSIRVTTEEAEVTKSPDTIRTPIQVTTEQKIIESIGSDEVKNRVPSSTPLTYYRRRPIGLGERRNRKPVRKTESQEIRAESTEEVSSTRRPVKHPSSINEQLLEIDSTEKDTSVETGTNNISVERDSTEEIRDILTTEVPTTTKYTRKYNRKGNRNWNSTRNSLLKNRSKPRNSTYFSRWGDRVRSTTELPTRIRVNHRTDEPTSTTTTSTTPRPTTTVEPTILTTQSQQAEESREDSEVYESQTISSIEIAPSEFAQSSEVTTLPTTKKEELTTTTLVSEGETTLIETTPFPTTISTQTTTQSENIYKNKTPEEIVNELTALGLRNSSQAEEAQTPPETQTNPPGGQIPPDLISRLQAGQYNVNLEDNETSLVVNRVSKSISFRTSRGLSGRLMQPKNIIPIL